MNPPQDSSEITKRPITFLEWAGAILGCLALFAEMIRRISPSLNEAGGQWWFNIIIFTSLVLTLLLVLPVLLREWMSPRRGASDFYLALIMFVTLGGSIYLSMSNWEEHFMGVLPIVLAGYAICKNKYRTYQAALESVLEDLDRKGHPEIEVTNEGENQTRRAPEDIKTGDTIRVSPGERIWVAGIISKGYGSINQASTTALPVPRRVHAGDTVAPGEILLDGELFVQVTEDGKPVFQKEKPRDWVNEYNQLSISRREKVLRHFWIFFIILIVAAQFISSHIDGNWVDGIMPAISMLIGLAPWGYLLAMPMLWRRRLTETASHGLRFHHLHLLEVLSRPIHVIVEKTGVFTNPGIVRKSIILSKYFRGKSAFIIRVLHSVEKASQYSLGSHYFTRSSDLDVNVTRFQFSDTGCIEAEVFDPEEHRIFVRAGSLKSMPYYTHNGFKQLSAEEEGDTTRQRLFVTLNDIPAAVLSWDEKLRPEAVELVNQSRKYGMPLTVHTLDPLGRIKQVGNQPVEKLSAAMDKLQAVLDVSEKRELPVYFGFGRSDISAMSASAGAIMMKDSDPGLVDYAEASIDPRFLAHFPREWLRFCRARRAAKYISWITGTHAGIILTLAARNILNPWLATTISAITGAIMISTILQVEKEPNNPQQDR